MLHEHEPDNQTSLIALRGQSQTSLVSVSGLVSGKELQLAATGTPAEIERYLDAQLAQSGRDAELHATDVISCEQAHRRLAALVDQGRIINASSPGGEGRLDEQLRVLATMACDISECGDLSDGQPLLLQRSRRLIMFDPRQSPPDIQIDSPAACRAFFTQQLALIYGQRPWDFYYRGPDSIYNSFIPEDLPKYGRGYSVDPDGTFWHAGKRATQAQMADHLARTPVPGVVVRIPGFEAITDLEHLSEQAFNAWLKARSFIGVDDISVLQDAGDAPGLAQRMAGLAASVAPSLWRGSKSDLARDLAWTGTIMELNALLRKTAAELAGEGWCLAKAGKTGPTRAQGFALLPLRPAAENPVAEIPGAPD